MVAMRERPICKGGILPYYVIFSCFGVNVKVFLKEGKLAHFLKPIVSVFEECLTKWKKT